VPLRSHFAAHDPATQKSDFLLRETRFQLVIKFQSEVRVKRIDVAANAESVRFMDATRSPERELDPADVALFDDDSEVI